MGVMLRLNNELYRHFKNVETLDEFIDTLKNDELMSTILIK